MATQSPNTFAELVLGKVEVGKPFRPHAYYDADGDCIEFLASDEPFYGERIDSLVTVYYGEESREIVGSLIKGVRRFIGETMKKVPGFRIDVQDGRVRLEHIFTAQLWHSKEAMPEPIAIAYKKLRDVAEKTDAAADLCVV